MQEKYDLLTYLGDLGGIDSDVDYKPVTDENGHETGEKEKISPIEKFKRMEKRKRMLKRKGLPIR